MKQQTIKFTAWNPLRRRREEVYPEDEFTLAEVIPMFLHTPADGSDACWVTVPDCRAAEVYDRWLAQLQDQ